jgi:hypothetical protein
MSVQHKQSLGTSSLKQHTAESLSVQQSYPMAMSESCVACLWIGHSPLIWAVAHVVVPPQRAHLFPVLLIALQTARSALHVPTRPVCSSSKQWPSGCSAYIVASHGITEKHVSTYNKHSESILVPLSLVAK